MLSVLQSDTLSEDAIDFVKKQWVIADTIHFGRQIVWTKHKKALLAKEDNAIVGVLEFTMQAGVMYIDELIVASAYQGQGIGTKLMQTAEKIAVENTLHKIYLDTGKDWEAMKFYEKLGYQQTGVLPNHYMKIDYIVFSKFL